MCPRPALRALALFLLLTSFAVAAELKIRVVDPQSARVAGARVEIIRATDQAIEAVRVTDARGEATANALPNGSYRIEVLAPDKASDPDFLERLRTLGPDCCPVVAYGALLRPAALEIPRHGWVNLHFSVLPAWRGAAPVQHAILAGDDVTGASTFRIEEGLDTGPVLRQEGLPLEPRANLEERIHAIEHRLLPTVVREMMAEWRAR